MLKTRSVTATSLFVTSMLASTVPTAPVSARAGVSSPPLSAATIVTVCAKAELVDKSRVATARAQIQKIFLMNVVSLVERDLGAGRSAGNRPVPGCAGTTRYARSPAVRLTRGEIVFESRPIVRGVAAGRVDCWRNGLMELAERVALITGGKRIGAVVATELA